MRDAVEDVFSDGMELVIPASVLARRTLHPYAEFEFEARGIRVEV